MANSVYTINKGINQPIEFKGLKAQWIGWLAAGCMVLLVVFALLYVVGVNTYLSLAIISISGTAWVMKVLRWSSRYGQHGLMKKIARRRVPRALINRSRQIFFADRFLKK